MKLMASLLHLESLNRLKFIKVDSASSYNFLIVFVLQKYKILRLYTNALGRSSGVVDRSRVCGAKCGDYRSKSEQTVR